MIRDGSRTAATSKMEHFVIIANGWKLLTIITKSSILNVAAVLNLPLMLIEAIDKTMSQLLPYLTRTLFAFRAVFEFVFFIDAKISPFTHPGSQLCQSNLE